MSAETKQCSWCREHKPVSEFGRKPQNRDGLKSHCRPCSTEAVRRSRQRHGYDRDRARRTAEYRAAAWVRENRPDVWFDLLAEAEDEWGVDRDLYERVDAEVAS